MTGAGRSVKNTLSDTTGKDDDVGGTDSDLDSAQTRQRSIGEADSIQGLLAQQRIYDKKLQEQLVEMIQKSQLS